MKGSSLTLHPEEEQLLRYLDGELPAQASSEVRSHLEACWQCRAALEQLQNVVSECVQYRKNVLQRHLPAPPAPWVDLYRHFDEIDASLEPVLFHRLGRMLQSPFDSALRRWAVAAVTLLVLVALFYRYRQTPSVQASELLRKAVAEAGLHPRKAGRIQIRTGNRRLTRPAVAAQNAPGNAADNDTLNTLQVRFQRANYSWNDPLSARSFETWRDQLNDKQDRVTEQAQGIQVETSSGSSELRRASMTLATADLQPLEAHFEFADREWVEITEVADDATPLTPGGPEAAARAAGSAPLRPPALPPATISPAVPKMAGAGDELQVIAALHDLGADLGEPLETTRSGGEIQVNGIGIAPARQQQIKDALAGLPHVVLHFSDSAPPPAEPAPPAPSQGSARTDARQLQGRLAEQLGGRANLDQIAAEILDSSDAMMARAFALRRLAETFSLQVEPELSSGDRQLLSRLRREHSSALRQQFVRIDTTLQSVLPRSAGKDGLPPDTSVPPGPWQQATEELFQSARRLDKLVGVMFGAAPSDIPAGQLSVQLKTSLAQLRSRLDNYERSNK